MKKALIIVLALALSIGAASMALATDTTNGSTTQKFMRGQRTEGATCPQLTMTDEEKAQMTSLLTQMLELRKTIIQENVTAGTITQAQATQMLERLDKQLEAVKSGQVGPGMGMRFHGKKGFSPGAKQQESQSS